jgi:diaminohydroxyphosphoribosylaminopyrimidine deaminase/5-amino-6-(5-phosphoribosylamino)uracil reductase
MMTRALSLAEQGLYTTAPNPRVGCVIACGAEIVGEGWHRKAGEPHAEVHALRAAGARARGATAYVTLEPCSHHGRTPPCAPALLAAGIGRLVCAVRDPNPKVDGQGMALLQGAGVEVDVGLLEEEARALNKGFFKRMLTGRPWITVKIAASLDGRVALANGASRWITSEDSRLDVQRLRARSCAVLTGVGTVIADDPRLTVRAEAIDTMGRQPWRVVCDTRARTPSRAQLLRESGKTLIYVAAGLASPGRVAGLESAGAEVIVMHELDEARAQLDSAQLDLKSLLADLGGRACNEVLVEAGPRLSASFIGAGSVGESLADEVVIYMAPIALGNDALSMLPLPAITAMEDRRNFAWQEVKRIGPDLKMTLKPIGAMAQLGKSDVGE